MLDVDPRGSKKERGKSQQSFMQVVRQSNLMDSQESFLSESSKISIFEFARLKMLRNSFCWNGDLGRKISLAG